MKKNKTSKKNITNPYGFCGIAGITLNNIIEGDCKFKIDKNTSKKPSRGSAGKAKRGK